jgi:hypothetical protein
MTQQTPSQELYNLLITRDFDPESLDSAGKPGGDPAKAVSFKFNYTSDSGKDYGAAVVMINNSGLNLFYGDNLGKGMDAADKNAWFSFLEQLKHFASGKFNSEEVLKIQDIGKYKYSMQGQAAIKEGLFEGWAGTKTRSWNGIETEARLMIKHKRVIGENDARFRYVESLFVETAEGERYKLPFTKLSAGRAMVEHVRQGGKPYDIRGNHIAQIVEEMNVLSRFRRANQGKIFEGATAQLIESAGMYYETLQHNLKSLSSKTGYTKYFEAWDPAAITDEDVIIEDLRHMFVEQNIDSRVEQALPLLAKLQREQEMKEANIFESWANLILEGENIEAMPDTRGKKAALIELLSQELPVGALAVNATTELEDLFLDSELAQQLSDLADENADADAREIILNRLEELKDNPDIAQVIGELTNQSSEEPAEEPEQNVTESRGADYEFETEITNPQWLAWESYEETEDNPLPPEPEEMISVTVSYNITGSYQQATWSDGGGSPAEGPEISIVSVIDNNTGEQIDPNTVVISGGGDLQDQAADDYYSMDEGTEDPLIQLRRSAGIHEDDMEEGFGTAAKKAIGAGAIGLAALGSGGAQAQTTDKYDPGWNAHSMTHHIRSDVSSTKGMNSADPSKDTNNFEKRIQNVTGPNAKGEYKVIVMQGHDIVSHYVTKTPPPNWLYKNNEVDEGLKHIAGAGALAAATALGGYAAGSHNSGNGFSNTKGIDQFNKPTTSQVAPAAKSRTDQLADLNRKLAPPGSKASKIVNLPSDFEEEKEMDEGALADIGDYVGGKVGGAAGLALSKGKIGAGKVGSRAGSDLLRKGGQWADNKIDKWLSSPEPEAKPTTGKSTPKMTAESGNSLAGQYGHSGKMKPVTGGDADTISRLKFLSGITK